MKINFKPIRAIVALVPFALLLNSCGRDFPSVQKIGKMADALEESSSKLADDIYNSCITRTKYISFLTAPGSSGSFPLREQEEKKCDDFNRPAVKNVKDANSVLVKYLKTLGKMASDDTVSFDKNFNYLGESLKKLQVPQANGKPFSFDTSDVNAGISITKFITNALTMKFRQEKLKQAILCTDKDIQTYIGSATSSVKDLASNQPTTGGLRALTEQAYVNGILIAEEQEVRNYFTNYIGGLTPVSQDHPLDFIKLEEDYNKAMDSIRTRKDVAGNYVAILQQIAAMHSNVKTEFQGKGEKQLSDAQLQDYCQRLDTAKADKAATKEKAITYEQEEIKNVGKIVSEYEKSLEPLIEKMNKGF
ncbi:hypothetical protein NIES4073_29880 [Kalymmatonema gypsitolerans NIES-4073]|nr:hypothetical protein NIES4073_29880 [Scytonema sp. NIES-4073]